MKQLCVYGETEKIRKYIVGEGIHKYALGKREKELCDAHVYDLCICVYTFPPSSVH